MAIKQCKKNMKKEIKVQLIKKPKGGKQVA